MNTTEQISIQEREIQLTSQQRYAVYFGEGPLLVIAGAGTGKTSCISHRVANLISTKAAKMEEILVLTFSEKAAAEMEERIDLILPYSFSDIWVSTFHSFGQRILRNHSFEIGLDPDFKALSEEEMIIFLQENMYSLPMNRFRPSSNPNRHLGSLVKYISRLKDEDISHEKYCQFARNIDTSSNDQALIEKKQVHMKLADIYRAIQDMMFEKGYIDLADLVFMPLQIFRNHPLIADIYRKKFKYILVDEFQDTNHSQYQLLKLLYMGRRNITVVGDDDQSIYKFRGAAISNILNFMDDFPDARQVVLTKNFRSPQKILDSAYRLIKHNNPYRLEMRNKINKMLEGREDPDSVLFHRVFDNLSTQAEYISSLIRKKLDEGYLYSDIAILIRNNRDAGSIISELNLGEIPFRFSGASGLYLRPEIRNLISFLRLIADPDDSLSLFFLAASEIYGLNPNSLTRVSLYADHVNKSLIEVFQNIVKIEELKSIPSQDIATIARIVSDIHKFTDLSTRLTSGRLLYEFLKQTGYLGQLGRAEVAHADLKTQNIAFFFDIIKRFEDISDHPFAMPFIKYLNNLIRAGDDPPAAHIETEVDAVSILTVHKSKGLEFPVVIIACLAEGNFPTRSRRGILEIPDELIKESQIPPDFHLQEERRLFYVAMTRSKKELLLLGVRDLGGKRKRKVSRFIMEALDIPLKSLSVKIVSPEDRIKQFAQPEEVESKPSQYPVIQTPLNLTPYHIDDYITCPLKYKYIHILRIPVIRHHAVVYGKAVRSAVLELIKRITNKVPVELKELLEVFSREWSMEGFFSREHEETRYLEGKSSISEFYGAYSDEIQTGDIADRDYCFTIDDIRITGSWDLLKINSQGTVIMDFRTSDVRDKKSASRKARDSIKNQVSLFAYRKIFGKDPLRLDSYFLKTGITGTLKPSESKYRKVNDKIIKAAAGISSGNYNPEPEYFKCMVCPYMEICPATTREL